MERDAKRRRESKETVARRTLNVQLSLPLLDALMGLKEDFFALCVRSGPTQTPRPRGHHLSLTPPES